MRAAHRILAALLALTATGAAGAGESAEPILVGGAMLPAGEGRDVLQAACTRCHDLRGLQAYKGYYDAEKWRGMVMTMRTHGAVIDDAQIAVLVDYLDRNFGPDSR